MTAPLDQPRPLAELAALGPHCTFAQHNPCPVRDDDTHCPHWYEGVEPCCYCGSDTDS